MFTYIDSLEDLTKLDITEVNVSNPNSEIVDINSVEGLEDLDSELSQVNLGSNDSNVSNMTDILNETPTLEKDVSNIKKIVIQPSELNDDDRRKKDVLKKYGRKRNFNFFNDSIESDDEF